MISQGQQNALWKSRPCSQLSLAKTLCMSMVISWETWDNKMDLPCVTLWLVFQYPVTNAGEYSIHDTVDCSTYGCTIDSKVAALR